MDLTVFLHCQLLHNENVTAVINKGLFIFDQYFESQIITRIRNRFVPSIDRQLVLWLVSFVTCVSVGLSVSQSAVSLSGHSVLSQPVQLSVSQSVGWSVSQPVS